MRIEQALARLPLKDREVLLLTAVECLSSTEAAAVLGLTPDTFRQRLLRSRRKLMALLESGSPQKDPLEEDPHGCPIT